MKVLLQVLAIMAASSTGVVLEETEHLLEATTLWQSLENSGYSADVQILEGTIYVYFGTAQDLNAVAFAVGSAGAAFVEADWAADKLICAFREDQAVVWITADDCVALCLMSEAGHSDSYMDKAFVGCLHFDNAGNW